MALPSSFADFLGNTATVENLRAAIAAGRLPQLLIKLGQVRTMIQRAQRRPAEAPRMVFIVTSASFMKEAANSLLKLLEEPPDYAHLILLAENTGELLPTIRSRCAVARLGALP